MKFWILGWDPSRNGYHAMVLINEHKQVLEDANVKDLEAAASQVQRFQDYANSEGYELLVGVETSDSIIPQWLVAKGFESSRLYELSTRKVAAYKQAGDVGSDKTDLLDAYGCCCYLMDWRTKLKAYSPPSPLEQRAFSITRELDRIRAQKTKAWEQFWGLVDRSNPEIKRLLDNKEVPWFVAVFTHMVGKMKHTSYPAFEKFCRGKGARSSEEVLKPLHKSLKMLEQWADSDIIRCRAKEIELRMQEFKIFEDKAREVLKDWEEGWILMTIKGMGPATMIRLLAHLGSDWSQHTVKGISKYAGLAPQLCASGVPDERTLLSMKKRQRSKHKVRRIHRLGCNKDLKTALCLFTKFSMKHNPWVHEAYKLKKEQGQGHWENLRNLSMKWVNIFVAMVRNQTAYDPHLHQNRTLTREESLMRPAA